MSQNARLSDAATCPQWPGACDTLQLSNVAPNDAGMRPISATFAEADRPIAEAGGATASSMPRWMASREDHLDPARSRDHGRHPGRLHAQRACMEESAAEQIADLIFNASTDEPAAEDEAPPEASSE